MPDTNEAAVHRNTRISAICKPIGQVASKYLNGKPLSNTTPMATISRTVLSLPKIFAAMTLPLAAPINLSASTTISLAINIIAHQTLKPITGYVSYGIYGAKTVGATKNITNELINNLSATGSKNLPKSVT